MAIFGKKKDKNDKDNSSVGTQSPTVDGRSARGGPGSRENTPGAGGAGGSLNGHQNNHSGSFSGPSGIPAPATIGGGPSGVAGASTYSQSNAGPQSQQPPQRPPGPPGGMTGSAAGYRFGGPTQSGIPQPNGSVRGNPAGRKFSQDAGDASAAGGPPSAVTSGLPPSSVGAPPPLSSQSAAGSMLPTGPNGERPRQHVVYPWSQRALSMNPPRYLDESRQGPAGAVSPSPFPRYGHAANSAASPTGEVYLFGGLVRESVKNDLYIVHVDKVSQPGGVPQPGSQPGTTIATGHPIDATLVQTTGEIPPPRVGHATVLVSNVLILWGGDTKVRADDRQDEGLYLLNLSTREWTRVKSDAPNSGPVGRYGHTVSIVGSRFYVFGGQVDGTFMNDLWSFDLNSLKGTPTWELLKPATSDIPPRRTGHASVTFRDKIYVFGGTDGQYHYNDTWCYDITSGAWKELSCIGYIPVPREGHATCLVDDVMYIFGGRGVDGRDLGDLASFKISNQRWYMFANMGPAPSGRSGHVLTTFQNKVLVLGGESFTSGGKTDDPAVVHVLDTAKIKYPPDGRSGGPSGSAAGSRKTSLQGGQSAPGATSQPGSPPSQSDMVLARSMSPTQSQQSHVRAFSPTGQPISPAASVNGPNGLVSVMQQAGSLDSNSARRPDATQSQESGLVQRAMSPVAQGQRTAPSMSAAANSQFPQNSRPAGQPIPYAGPRSQRSIENLRNQNSGAVSPTNASAPRTINGALERSVSPTGGFAQEGFHYGTRGSPSLAAQSNGFVSSRGELEAMRKREAWMKAALLLASKKGFISPDDLEMPDGTQASARDVQLNLDTVDTGAEGSDKDRIVRALVTLKSQLSSAKATIAQQAQSEADRVAEADRGRLAALQEAAFFRAKLHALEKSDVAEATRLDRERAAHSEKQLADALRESAELERQVQSLREDLKLEMNLRASAEERLSETAKRAMAAEGAQMRAYDELAMLQKRSYGHETQLREHQDQVTQLTSLVARHRSDHETARGQLEEAQESLQQHTDAFVQLQAALQAAQTQATEHERLHFRHRDVADQHQDTINRLRAALDAKTAEVGVLTSRVTDLEALANTHKGEAEANRSALGSHLTQLVAYHQSKGSNRSRSLDVPEHVEEKITALEAEAESLRQLHSQSRSAADSASTALQDLRERNLALEKQHTGLRTELSAMRSQLAIALHEVSRLKDHGSSKDLELRDHARALEAAQLRDSLLRQYISDRGIEVPGDDQLSAGGNFADRRIGQLEAEIDARAKALEVAEARLQESTSRIEALNRELAQRGSGASGGVSREADDDREDLERRVEMAERELSRSTAAHNERMGQVESDYQTAVQFVKGSEKMLRRMKDELTKYKTENASLQSELATARTASVAASTGGGDDAAGSGAEAAKDIEALRTRLVDISQQAEETAAENRELEKKLAALIANQKDFHDRSKVREDSQLDQSRRAVELEGEVSRLRKEVHEMLSLNEHLSNELKGSRSVGSVNMLNGFPSAQSGLSQYGSQASHRELDVLSNQNEQLKVENDGLARRLQETEDKLGLLLGRIESSVDGDSTNHAGPSGVGSASHHAGGSGVGVGVGVSGAGGSSASNGSHQLHHQLGGGGGGGGGQGSGSASGNHGEDPGARFSITSELEKWERDGSLLGVGVGHPNLGASSGPTSAPQ
ncbi:unnamed protein product [Parajaminaea phylloscopi]